FNLESLGDDGRDALLALALFVPSASREALAAVVGLGREAGRSDGAIKRLRALWLIKGMEENSRFTVEGLTRTRSGVRLSEDARAGEFRRRFVSYFVDYAEAHAQETPEDFALLETEKDNLLRAMDVAFEMEDWESIGRTRYALQQFLDLHGYWDEAIRHGEQALKAAKMSESTWNIGAFANGLGTMFANRGDYASAKNHYELSVEIARQIDTKQGLAATLHELGRLAQAQGEMEEARRLYEESLEISKRLSDQSGIALTLHALANLASNKGDLTEARLLYNQSLEITGKLGDKGNLALIFYNLGLLTEQEGDKAEAMRLFRESLSIFEKLKSPNAEIALRNLERVEGQSS
ncbi:MAG: tetratricopeptide repeat protein, partial [Acidobacteria bacterium]|nr:tetratricopeptide repeat protein [Acidobacteriota bacterium]